MSARDIATSNHLEVEVSENEDGSCDLTLKMADTMADKLFGIGLQRVIDEVADGAAIVEKLKGEPEEGTKMVEVSDDEWRWFIGYAVKGILEDAVREKPGQPSEEETAE
jgi:hypothetical protein